MIDVCVHYFLIGAERCRRMRGSKSLPEKVTFELRLIRMAKSHRDKESSTQGREKNTSRGW